MAARLLKTLCLCCLLTTVRARAAEGTAALGAYAEELLSRFQQEAPRQWQAHREHADRLVGSIDGLYKQNGKVFSAFHSEFKQNARCRLIRSEIRPPLAPKGELFAFNSRYGFHLVKNSPEKPWVITECETRKSEADDPWVKKTDFFLSSAHYPLTIDQVDLADLVKRPTFRVEKIALLDGTPNQIVRVDFDNANPLDPASNPHFCKVQGGTIFLDPEHYWCITAFAVTIKAQNVEGTANGEHTWRMEQGVPIPTRVIKKFEMVVKGKGKSSDYSEMLYDCTIPSTPPSDDEFTLAAFDLPEPFDAANAPARTRWYLWLGLAGGAFLVLGFLVRPFTKRTTDTTPG